MYIYGINNYKNKLIINNSIPAAINKVTYQYQVYNHKYCSKNKKIKVYCYLCTIDKKFEKLTN